ncbi:hypothetical protein EMIHUDRAFT_105226 [Emiliania huxleyi CCMP1516]|uniref:Uncharacterized protein n=2 Tax=Emiliania huxleyi TaxID=2903 RepID=A0A0D3IGW0_EMIH1|nr:hypothetical protein EMIHUDRAFT_105226 [Emiliania huxleyi CCMP1516]EOD10495.1 hypothetical protein EMIHUDRAFT_105226 [Emiliania huxleyi CCMP1516]|eukprot:XP_005762924.1 hypothetical protein EMIHUDRAFT_105226 [Emiliania huxleyi CCMP1516]
MHARTAALRAAFAGSSRGAISRAGLHPLVVPLAEAEGGTVLGSLSWRLDATGDPGDAPASASEATLVEVQRGGLFVRPLGTPAHVARRAAVEADLAGGDGAAEAVGFFSAAAVEAGGLPYTRGAHAESGLSLDQFLLLRVQAQGDETRGVKVAPEEVWRRAALDLMDAVVLRGGEWGEISADLAKALERAGLQEQAERVRGGG